MLMIRLQRVGRKNVPTFRVVLTNSQNSTKSGKYLEVLGAYDPRQDGIRQFNGDRIKEWIGKGAQLSGTMHNLLVSEKIITGKKINVLPKKTVPAKPVEAEKKSAEATPATDAPVPAEEKKAE
jgi:small subunit ribosomal protein S16